MNSRIAVIEIKNISKSFKGNTLFENVSAVFEKGKIYGVTGHNGSGKSVLFKMICGFIKPEEGRIDIHPEYREGSSGFPGKLGIIIDRPGYMAGKTGFENLKRWSLIQNKITDQDIKHSLQLVGLNAESEQKVKNYSLGMKQKLALAQAIMEGQEVLILDEPFNGLDADSVDRIRRLLLAFKADGKTILLTSHNKEDIQVLCDEVYHIQDRQLIRNL